MIRSARRVRRERGNDERERASESKAKRRKMARIVRISHVRVEDEEDDDGHHHPRPLAASGNLRVSRFGEPAAGHGPNLFANCTVVPCVSLWEPVGTRNPGVATPARRVEGATKGSRATCHGGDRGSRKRVYCTKLTVGYTTRPHGR